MKAEAVETVDESLPVYTPPAPPEAPASNNALGFVEPTLPVEDRSGVPLMPLISSIGWVTELASMTAYAVAGPVGVAGLVVGGLAAACAVAGAGNRFKRRPTSRPRAARPAGRGASSTRSGLGSTGLAGGGRRSGGGSSGGSRGGGILRGMRGGSGTRSGSGRTGSGSGSTGTGRSGKRLLPGLGSGIGGRRGTGSSSSGGGQSAGRSLPRFGRGSGGSGSSGGGSGRRGLFGLGRRTGSAGRGAGSSLGGGSAKRTGLRRLLPKGVGGSAGGSGPLGSSTAGTKRRSFVPRWLRPNRGAANGGDSTGTPTTKKAQRFPWLRSANWRRKATAPTAGSKPHVATKVATAPGRGVAADPQKKAPAPPPAQRVAIAPPGSSPIATSGGTVTATGKLRIVDLSNEMAANMSAVTVERGEMYPFLREAEMALPAASDNLARMWHGFGQAIANGMPLHPAIVALMDNMAVAQRTLGETARELPRMVRILHEAEIKRFEAPRPNENAWNTP